jgi:hypothetical protein
MFNRFALLDEESDEFKEFMTNCKTSDHDDIKQSGRTSKHAVAAAAVAAAAARRAESVRRFERMKAAESKKAKLAAHSRRVIKQSNRLFGDRRTASERRIGVHQSNQWTMVAYDRDCDSWRREQQFVRKANAGHFAEMTEAEIEWERSAHGIP